MSFNKKVRESDGQAVGSSRSSDVTLAPPMLVSQVMSRNSTQQVRPYTKGNGTVMESTSVRTTQTHGYAPVNGLKMYYEIEGTGDPLVYLPPALACAGLNSFPALVQKHAVITVDFQGYGRTADLPERPITLEQNAKDVIGFPSNQNRRVGRGDFGDSGKDGL
jgi:hypothetical protein